MVALVRPMMPPEMAREFAPLFERARQEALWFWCHYQDLWFSPDELAAHHRDGRFCWSAVNWKLRNPQEHLASLKGRVIAAQQAVETFEKRLPVVGQQERTNHAKD